MENEIPFELANVPIIGQSRYRMPTALLRKLYNAFQSRLHFFTAIWKCNLPIKTSSKYWENERVSRKELPLNNSGSFKGNYQYVTNISRVLSKLWKQEAKSDPKSWIFSFQSNEWIGFTNIKLKMWHDYLKWWLAFNSVVFQHIHFLNEIPCTINAFSLESKQLIPK